jgi:Family of unknown function (DUF5709)
MRTAMDTFDPYPKPVSDPAADGLPEVADPDSFADDDRDPSRIDSYPAPPDREDGPLALEDYGITADERLVGEPLRWRLRRERPDLTDESLAVDAPPQLYTDTVSEQTEGGIGTDSDVLDDGPVDPRLNSPVSMYDRDVPGIPSLIEVGRLTVTEDDTTGDEVAFDAGATGGGFTAEEGAMHEVPDEDLTVQGGPSEPYVRERTLGPLIRTGSEQPWDPEDLAVAEGRDPTRANVERARRELAELGRAAIEKTVP